MTFRIPLQYCFRTALQDRKSFRIQYQYTGSGCRTGIQYRMHVNATSWHLVSASPLYFEPVAEILGTGGEEGFAGIGLIPLESETNYAKMKYGLKVIPGLW